MDNNTQVWVGMAALGLTAVTAFAVYWWLQRKRIEQVEEWVKDYLRVRFGELPIPLSIHCSNDALWPVFVAFDTPRTGIRRNLQFTCAGPHSTLALLSEKEEQR